MQSKQGHFFGVRSFPSPWTAGIGPISFDAECRCLIDLDVAYIVLVNHNNEEQLFRLETDRNSLPIDSTPWTKEQCVLKLSEMLNLYHYADIIGINFPYFDDILSSKFRASIALYGDSPNHKIYISFYAGAPDNSSDIWLLQLDSDKLSPKHYSQHTVDISKVCTIPSWVEGVGDTWRDFYHGKHPLKLHAPEEFRAEIISCFINLAVKNPIQYSDTTRNLDKGTIVQKYFARNNEVYWKYITFQ